MTSRPTGQISCPDCDAPAPVRARVCTVCGYRFLEDRRPGRVLIATAATIAAVAAAVVLIPGGGDARPYDVEANRAADPPRVVELLSNHPLSARAVERRLEGRFTSKLDDDSAAARCSAREPRPAHAIRRCRISYPNGARRSVVILLDARGRELLSEY